MSQQETLNLRQTQVQTYVSFTSFMTAVVVFFTGLILTQFNTYDISIKVPLSFLMISISGFLFSTLIYTKVAESIAQRKLEIAKKNIFLGDIISEYIGVYLLILSIPLVVNVITDDIFLRLVTLFALFGGFGLYQFSHFSIIERHFKNSYHTFSLVLIALGILLFFAQQYQFYFIPLAGLTIAFILGITYIACKKEVYYERKTQKSRSY